MPLEQPFQGNLDGAQTLTWAGRNMPESLAAPKGPPACPLISYLRASTRGLQIESLVRRDRLDRCLTFTVKYIRRSAHVVAKTNAALSISAFGI